MPIVVIFYEDNRLTPYHIFLLQGIYSVAIVVLEIPSGYFADVLGRKKTLIMGSILGFLGYVVYSFSFGFYGFLLAEIVLGMGQSLISGADSAMLYDSLVSQKREKEYLKFEGRVISIGNFAEALAGIAGGFLATLSYRTPYIGQAIVAFIAIPASLMLVEPPRLKTMNKLKFNDILKIFKFALVENKPLRLNIIFSSIIGCATLTMAWFVQLYFNAIDLPVAMFGVLWTLLNLTVGVASLFAYKIEAKLGQVKTIFLITLIVGGSYFILGSYQAYWGLGILFIFHMMRGVATPVLKDYINKMTDSEIRATVLSVRNFIIRLLFAGIGPLLGYLTGSYSLSLALTLAGGIFGLFGLLALYFYKKVLT
jgi:MFS family permease